MEYVFSWDKVPGPHELRLKKFLVRIFHAVWILKAEFSKYREAGSITLFDGKHSISLRLSPHAERVLVKNEEDHKQFFLEAKLEQGEINIYPPNKLDHYGKDLPNTNDNNLKASFYSKNPEEIKDAKEINIVEGIRKFANRDNLLVVKTIEKSGALTLSELKSITGIATNDLNHRLGTLRGADIVIKIGKKYGLTVYGNNLLMGLYIIEAILKRNKEFDISLFGAYDPNLDPSRSIETGDIKGIVDYVRSHYARASSQ